MFIFHEHFLYSVGIACVNGIYVIRGFLHNLNNYFLLLGGGRRRLTTRASYAL